MTRTTNMRSQLLDDACAMIEETGGVGVLLDGLGKGCEIFARIRGWSSRFATPIEPSIDYDARYAA